MVAIEGSFCEWILGCGFYYLAENLKIINFMTTLKNFPDK
jgi:hypothetical protein